MMYGDPDVPGVVTRGFNFRPWDYGQAYLLQPDLRDWLPADHEVWVLLEAASLLDLSDFSPAVVRS